MPPEQLQLLKSINDRLSRVESNLGGLTNDPRQVEVIRKAVGDKLVLQSLETTSFGLTVDPIGQQSNIANPTGGATVDSEARTAINSVISALEAFGLTAS